MNPQDPPVLNGWLIALNVLALLVLGGIVSGWIGVVRRVLQRRALVEGPTPRLATWGPTAVVGTIGLYVMLNLLVVAVYGALQRGGAFGPPPPAGDGFTPDELMGLMAIQNLLLLGLIPPLLRGSAQGEVDLIGADQPQTLASELTLGFRSFFVVAPLAYGLFYLAQQLWPPQQHPVFELLAERLTATSAVLSIVAAVILAPLTEELIFRGVLLGALTRMAAGRGLRARPDGSDAADLGGPPTFAPESFEPEVPIRWRPRGLAAWGPNVVVSLLFAGLHYGQWPAPIPLFVLSMALGWLAQRTGRLAASIALHATFNGASTLMMLLLVMSGLPIPGAGKAPVVPPGVVAGPHPGPGVPPAGHAALIRPHRDLTAFRGDLGFGRQADPGPAPRVGP